ncbi:glycosyltransferase [Oryzomonas japonica]|uniref:Glycosyltransferase n=1 Tax=Oryzomonas japonica TaxID=2603858 RepID=A0A7J4ZV89_9BACT|nr:glycosyltransferase [Oryzomonas japonica]KAB0666859.1 glycosyltransferase [Oryzomonas japonica]
MSIHAAIKSWLDDIQGKKKYQRYKEQETRTRRVLGQIFAILNIPCAVFYFSWCVYKANWQYWYTFIPFILSESVFLVHYLLWINLLWYKRHHHPEGVIPQKKYSVDVFIPVCREPLEIVRRTVMAACAIDYENKTVYILDDGEDDKLLSMAEEFCIGYIRRPTHENRKAGNLNYAFSRTNGDLILALDADQVAESNILKSIVGYFSIPRIAFVQTEQRFKLPKNDPWGNSDEVFYKAMQSGKDNDNAAISCGNGVVYRREALMEIGGFSEWNLVEDLHTSMRIHAKGWKTVYHDTAFTIGHAPEDVCSHLKQRWQWAVDSLRLFFWDSPLRYKGLSWRQKAQYLHFGYNYISFGIFLPIFFLLPIWSLFTHNFMLKANLSEYFLARLPYFIVYLIANKLLTDGLNNYKVFQCQAGLFYVYFSAAVTALRCRTKLPDYTVTSKVKKHSLLTTKILSCWPHMLISVFSLIAIVYGIVTIDNDPWFLIVNIFWATWTIVTLSRFIGLSLWPQMYMR